MRALLLALFLLFGCTAVGNDYDDYDGPEAWLVVVGDAVRDPTSRAEYLVDFGRVRFGELAERTVILRNTGLAPAEISPLWLEPPFATDLLATETLAGGEERTITISFTPDGLGPRDVTGIAIGTGLRSAIRVAAEVLPPPICRPEVDGDVVFAWSSWAPAVIEQRIDIRNIGDADCAIGSVELEGSPAYSLAGLASEVVRPGESVPVAVLFDRLHVDRGPASLHLELGSTTRTVELVDEEFLIGPCDIALRGGSLGFGSVAVGTEHERTIEIRNRGAEACRSGTLTLATDGFDPFAWEFVDIEPGESASFAVTFRPLAEGAYAGKLYVNIGGRRIDVPVIGHAVASCAVHQEAIDFGEVAPGCATEERFLEIRNRCSEPLVLDALDIPTDEGATDEFKVRRRPSGFDGGVSIGPGATAELTLAYVPEDDGADEGTIQLGFAAHPTTAVRLRGRSGAHAVQVDKFRQPGWEGPRTRFYLTNQPVDLDEDGAIEDAADEIRLELDGAMLPAVDGTGAIQWEFNEPANAVDFHEADVPASGSVLRVAYHVACLLP